MGAWNGSGFSAAIYDPIAGHYFDPVNGTYFLQNRGPGGPGGTPAAPPSMMSQYMGAAASTGAGYVIGQALGATASGYGASLARGEEFYPQRLAPVGLVLAGTAIGAVGGPVGAGIGASVGGLAGAALSPLIERDISLNELSKIERRMGMDYREGRMSWPELVFGGTGAIGKWAAGKQLPWEGPPNAGISLRARGLATGRRLAEATYTGLEDTFAGLPGQITSVGEALQDQRYSEFGIQMLGIDPDRELSELDQLRLLESGAYGNEFATGAKIMTMGRQAEGRWLTYRGVVSQSRQRGLQRLSAGQAMQNRLFGYGAISDDAYLRRESQIANLMRAEGAYIRELDPTDPRANQMLTGAEMTMLDAHEAVLGRREQNSAAKYGYDQAMADAAFQRRVMTGGEGTLEAEARAGLMRSRSSGIRAEIDERGWMMPETERWRRMAEAAGLELSAESVQRDSRIRALGIQELDAAGARGQYLEGAASRRLYGSLIEEAEGASDRLAMIKAEREEVERQLAAYREIDGLVARQLEVRRSALAVAQQEAAKAADLARVQAEVMTGDFYSDMASRPAREQALMGRASVGTQQAMFMRSIQNLRTRERGIQALMDSGFDFDSGAMQEMRNQLADTRLQMIDTLNAMGNVPVPAEMRRDLARLGSDLAVARAGYGGNQGTVRSNLQSQMGIYRTRVEQIDAQRSTLEQQGLLTPEADARLTEDRAQMVNTMAGLQMEHDEGWDQRLISQAYNWSGQMSLGASRYTRADAAMRHGVRNRAFGGTHEQVMSYRFGGPSRYGSAHATGNPEAFSSRNVAAALEVNVNILEGGYPIGQARSAIESWNTAQSTQVNVDAQRRPK